MSRDMFKEAPRQPAPRQPAESTKETEMKNVMTAYVKQVSLNPKYTPDDKGIEDDHGMLHVSIGPRNERSWQPGFMLAIENTPENREIYRLGKAFQVTITDEVLHKVVINGLCHEIASSMRASDTLTFEEICAMAGKDTNVSVTFTRPDGRGGTVPPHGHLVLENGLVINAVHTGNG